MWEKVEKMSKGINRNNVDKKPRVISKIPFVAVIMLISVFVMLALNALPATAAGKGTVVNGDITEDTRWTLGGSPYILDGMAITIHNDDRSATLTIEAGVEVRARSYRGDPWGINPTHHGGITVGKNGALKVLGSALNPVVFTSASDERNAGDWSSIVIAADSRASETVIQNAIIEYSGFTNAAISIEGGTPRISSTHFRFIDANGIYIKDGATPTIEYCRFENNSEYAIMLDDSIPHLANNSFANDQVIGFNIGLYGRNRQQPITHSGTLDVPGVMDNGRVAPYDLGNCLGIRIFNETTPVTLTIDAGVVVQGHVTSHGASEGIFHDQISVSKNAALKVLGTADEPVVFTSAVDPDMKNGGQWGGVVFEADSRASDSIIQHAVFEYGGSEWVSTYPNPGYLPGMISVYGGAPRITDSLFRWSNVSGLYLEENAHPSITGCTFTENNIGMTFNVKSPLTISGNIIVNNIDYGASNENSDVIIDMTDNWWGDVSGPLDDSDDREAGGWYNPEGRGDNVSDFIKYKPWLTSTPSTTSTPSQEPSTTLTPLQEPSTTLTPLQEPSTTLTPLQEPSTTGSLWLSDFTADKIYKLDRSGNVLASFDSPGSVPSGLAWDGMHLWNLDKADGKIYRLDTDGTVIGFINAPGYINPTYAGGGLAWDGTYLWCTDDGWGMGFRNRIFKLDTSGNVIASFEAPQDDSYSGDLAWDGASLWYVRDYTAASIGLFIEQCNEIYRLDTTGSILSHFTAPGPGSSGLAWDGAHLWIADAGDDMIYQLDNTGKVLMSFGSPGPSPIGLAWEEIPTSTSANVVNCIYFNTGAWTDLSSVFAGANEVFGYTNNMYGGTAYMYLWLSFESPLRHMSLRPCPDDLNPQTTEPNWGDRAQFETEEITSRELATRLAADEVPGNLGSGLIGPYIYRLIVTAPDHGYHSSYIFSFDASPNYAIGKGEVDDLEWSGRVRVCNIGAL
ncbi:MAG: right-handed parallel beta-helix repeat-containing protein [Methanotrichaceae archaeon]|nr:right-handed parallel beta-helix repeat-containing protein [Methanotrichaceae archaeon]